MSKKNDLDKMIELSETVASARECTGLMARGPVNDYEYENYMSLMKFSPEDIKTKKNKAPKTNV